MPSPPLSLALAAGALACSLELIAWRRRRSSLSRLLSRVASLEAQLTSQASDYEAMLSSIRRANGEEESSGPPPPPPPLYRVVLTGGPCGGKTTALSEIKARLDALGFLVLCVPEAATLLFSGGARLPSHENSALTSHDHTSTRTRTLNVP